jgi:transcriptional regulator with XRE-family HTH domain
VALERIVAENIRAVRKDLRLSQETLARKCGVSVSYISMLERGQRTPPLKTLEVLAKGLSVTPLNLLQDLAPSGRRARGGR